MSSHTASTRKRKSDLSEKESNQGTPVARSESATFTSRKSLRLLSKSTDITKSRINYTEDVVEVQQIEFPRDTHSDQNKPKRVGRPRKIEIEDDQEEKIQPDKLNKVRANSLQSEAREDILSDINTKVYSQNKVRDEPVCETIALLSRNPPLITVIISLFVVLKDIQYRVLKRKKE
jgi:hypothetical protein